MKANIEEVENAKTLKGETVEEERDGRSSGGRKKVGRLSGKRRRMRKKKKVK